MQKRTLTAKIRLLKGFVYPCLHPQVFLGRPDSHSTPPTVWNRPNLQKIGGLFDGTEKVPCKNGGGKLLATRPTGNLQDNPPQTHPPTPRRRVKQLRFGKLAFLLQNGALFESKIGDFRPFSHYVSSEKPGNAYFCRVTTPFHMQRALQGKNPPFFAANCRLYSAANRCDSCDKSVPEPMWRNTDQRVMFGIFVAFSIHCCRHDCHTISKPFALCNLPCINRS